MPQDQETRCAIALSRLGHFSLADMLELYRRAGSAQQVVEHRGDIRSILPDASDRLVNSLKGLDEALRRADAELAFTQRYGITALTYNSPDYPQRLRECEDAPLVLFVMGRPNLNRAHVVSIVGTRHCSSYGADLVQTFCKDLQTLCPDVLIVSGLAYGIDIQAHRQALAHQLDTAAVLAHGLDTIYPRANENTARQMVTQGGLVTEFLSGTNADKLNFVRRNRIIAGLADATVVVESPAKGGSLITANIAQDYNREVFAFPGSIGQPASEGCNRLIQRNKAILITCAEDLLHVMGWEVKTKQKETKQDKNQPNTPNIANLSPDEQRIVALLYENNDMQVNTLAAQLDMHISIAMSTLFTLEMKGLVRQLAGSVYHLRIT